MNTTQNVIGIASEKGPEPFGAGAPPTEDDAELPRPDGAGQRNVSLVGRKSRVKVAVIYALTTIIPLLVMFYIIQANLFLRSSMGVISVSILALIALGIALLGGKIMKEVWGKVGQAVETIERLRTESEPFKDMSHLEDIDEIDRIPTVVTHLVEIAKRQMNELKAYNDQVQHLNSELTDANEKLHQISTEDSLTGLYNRRHFDERIGQEIARTLSFGRDLALAMVDIDFFKNYNDNIGHPAGDKALATIGELMRKSIRETDLAFRYGGEELVIIMPETTVESALSVAERIRGAVEKHPFDGESSQPNGSLTVSIGLSVLEGKPKTEEEFVSAADKALYKAKSLGRNRVVRFSDD